MDVRFCNSFGWGAAGCRTGRAVVLTVALGVVSNDVQDPRVQGLVLVDPVDNSSFGPQGVGEHLLPPALEELLCCLPALLCLSCALGYPAGSASCQPASLIRPPHMGHACRCVCDTVIGS
jgi:hypothetical protein